MDFITCGRAEYISADIISDKNAKWQFLSKIKAYDDKGNHVQSFCLDDAVYVYVDRKCTIQGYDRDYQYDCSFTKGWNVVYFLGNKMMTKNLQMPILNGVNVRVELKPLV